MCEVSLISAGKKPRRNMRMRLSRLPPELTHRLAATLEFIFSPASGNWRFYIEQARHEREKHALTDFICSLLVHSPWVGCIFAEKIIDCTIESTNYVCRSDLPYISMLRWTHFRVKLYKSRMHEVTSHLVSVTGVSHCRRRWHVYTRGGYWKVVRLLGGCHINIETCHHTHSE